MIATNETSGGKHARSMPPSAFFFFFFFFFYPQPRCVRRSSAEGDAGISKIGKDAARKSAGGRRDFLFAAAPSPPYGSEATNARSRRVTMR